MTLENEELFVSICGYEGFYEISNVGNVKSLERIIKTKTGVKFIAERILSPSKSHNGYLSVVLCKNNTHKHHRINRLVAEAFINNPENKSEVNHIDGNKLNNNVSNLEWVTRRENAIHAHKNGLMKSVLVSHGKKGSLNHKSIPVEQYDLNMNFIKRFDSFIEAEQETGISHSLISNCTLGKQKRAKMFIFKRLESVFTHY